MWNSANKPKLKPKPKPQIDTRKLKEGEYGYAIFPSGRVVKVTDKIIDSLSVKCLCKLCPSYKQKAEALESPQLDNCPLSLEDRQAVGKALLKRSNQHHLVRSLYKNC